MILDFIKYKTAAYTFKKQLKYKAKHIVYNTQLVIQKCDNYIFIHRKL